MKQELKKKLIELNVSAVYLFGSRVTGINSPSSDVDIGVVFKAPLMESDNRALYRTLYEAFSGLYRGSKIDIVFLQIAPLSLQYSAIKEGKILFEEDPLSRADYEYRVVNLYLDFRPVLDYFDQALEERYAKV